MSEDDARVYRFEWRDVRAPLNGPPTVMLRVAWNPQTLDLRALVFELQAAVHAMTYTLQKEQP